MAIANQLKALLKSHVDGDNKMFLSIAMQMAAHEAKQGVIPPINSRCFK